MKPNAWLGLEQWVDEIVDARFAEMVYIVPWADGTTVYTPGEQGPDPTRRMLVTQAVFLSPGAALVGESGRSTGGSGGGFDTKLLEQECWISVMLDNIGDITAFRESDRVYLADRDQWYTISYLADNATRRPNIHLIAVHDLTSGEDNPVNNVTPTSIGQLYFNTTNKKFYRATGSSNTAWQKL